MQRAGYADGGSSEARMLGAAGIADGRLTILEANATGRANFDPDFTLTVDASKLTITNIGSFDSVGIATARLAYGIDWLTHGNIAIQRGADGAISILSERYNFEMHTVQQHNNSVFGTAIGNFETIVGAIFAKQGNKYQNFVGFNIQFRRSPKID
jgi:predicted amidohydrolase